MFLIKRELRRLQRQLDEIVKTDTNAQLTTAASDKDVAALAVSINAMLERNRRGLYEKDRAEAALKRAVTNISHDLRTPLTSALGYLQMLDRRDAAPDERTRYLEIIRGRLEALSSLMNSLHEFACVIEGDIGLTVQKVNIGNTLRDVLSESYVELENKGFSVDINIPDAPEICMCDETALRRVLQNLIRNVYIHGRDYLRAGLIGGVIEIANKADGLAEIDAEQIFERFYTADASRTGKGTGLGLAITKELITQMGGSISACVEGDLLVIRVVLMRG
ncbi:MAG: HAMP domain-containing histidine kinase [Oscillospiraceae bacterium]|jgi:signal transduction histidine kinase|nr:HAMP domain-containing histidine kinase [Oscillospiraceae bacterium]